MEWMGTVISVVGIGLCLISALGVAHWSSLAIRNRTDEQIAFKNRLRYFRSQMEQPSGSQQTPADAKTWSGYRDFQVDRMVQETATCTSVYLVPADGKPLPHFRPGQHLTFKFQVPDIPKPVVRCYSLSDGPGKRTYRISVKRVAAPIDQPNLPPGKASTYVNRHLQVGQIVSVKAPAGHFYLDETSHKPVVLLAGGIGITPMISMLDRLIQTRSERPILLVSGMRNGDDHAFKKYLAEINGQHSNVHLLNCYSSPSSTDRSGIDFHFHGRVSVDLLKKVLPGTDCEFYLCGPPAFMNSLYEGLLDWGANESDIRFEAFGPASIGNRTSATAAPISTETSLLAIKFARSDTSVVWDGSHSSVLELAEAHDIPIDSGCRSGNCGTCEIELMEGTVEYPEGLKPDCEPGHCLACIARPTSATELGA